MADGQDEIVTTLAESLRDYDQRTAKLIDYWFETPGGGWVRPDWDAIAKLAVGLLRAEGAMPEPAEVTHRCPLPGLATTPCCDLSPFQLPRTDRLTVDDALVTCVRSVDSSPEDTDG